MTKEGELEYWREGQYIFIRDNGHVYKIDMAKEGALERALDHICGFTSLLLSKQKKIKVTHITYVGNLYFFYVTRR